MNPELKKVIDQQNQVRVNLINNDNIYRTFSPYEPTLSQVFSASFNQFAPYEAITRLFVDEEYEVEEGYDPFADNQIKDAGLEGYIYRFKDSGSSGETAQRIQNMKRDIEDMEILASTDYILPQVLSSLTSPAIFAPLAPLRYLRAAKAKERFKGGFVTTGAAIAPEEIIMAQELESRDIIDSTGVILTAGIIGGSLSTVLGKYSTRMYFNEGPVLWAESVDPTKTTKTTTTAKSKPFSPIQSVETKVFKEGGAGINPQRSRETAYATMDQDALKETGVGIEKLPWNPVTRLLQSPNALVRNTVAKMVDLGGMQQKKVDSKLAMDQSLETTFRTTYTPSLVKTLNIVDEQYLSYRGVQASDGDIQRSYQVLSQKVKDVFKKSDHLTESEFRSRIAKAVRNNGDTVNDSATPYVNASATQVKKHLDLIKDNAQQVKLFEKQAGKRIKSLEAKIAKTTDPAQKAKLTEDLQKAKGYLEQIRVAGVMVNTADGFFPRIWRVDKIMDNQDQFIATVSQWAGRTYGLDARASRAFANEMMDQVTRSKPYYDLPDEAMNIDWITNASSTKARTFEIPDNLIDDFLENDIESVLRHHTRTMGMDIELTRTFGDIDIADLIKAVEDDYKILIKEAPNLQKRRELKKNLANDLRDIKGLRDRLRGTYGASKDPHATSSRFVRAMKSFNVLVGMGGAVVSSIPDLVRPMMVEGLRATNEKGIAHFFKQSRSILKQMTKKELQQAGVAADAVLGLRASQFADIGDTFGSRFAWERRLNQSTGIFFIANGLNWWNQIMKEFAGTTTMLRMTDQIMKPWASLTRRDQEKFLSNGIDQQMHSRMALQIRQHGQRVDGEFMPNTDFWTDATARKTFRNALNQTVERTIITPGAGDRALWTSTEFGSLMTQFKSYGQGAMVRLLTAGLQEKDAAFWQGLTWLVGLSLVVNEIKKAQYGIDDSRDTINDVVIDAVDRSGALGWFTDVNNTLEKVSDYKLGLRPLLGSDTEKPMPFGAKAGALFGPAGGNIATLGSVGTDLATFSADQKTLDSARFVLPGGNLFYLDPVLDGIFKPSDNAL
tara:strand:- start:965 stop:4153 length:3189 start_codon:yes stop_codon:yes gene_type:complete